ncbi:transposase [Brevibacterium otitidis]|uniref:Transposase n=2 Tax=Brevibacterium otitidis TaxID=53364 RepID=A0ABV5X3D1_9MICO|nr:hypothetical protein GCM10023233_12350 [Brevibacterium otitidis]
MILPQVPADIRVPRAGGGRARTCPNAVVADRAYGAKANREYVRSRDIRAAIPKKKEEIATRKKRSSMGGWPPVFDAAAYRNRNVVERSFAYVKQWRG